MERGLVVAERTDEHRALLREAGEHANGANAELVLLRLMTEAEYETDAETLASIGSVENVSYDSRAVLDAAANDLQEMARDVLPENVGVDIVAKATDEDDIATAVLDTVADHDCDHVFVLGRHRSPAGKALFGDVAQRIVLDFDGYVTLNTG
ncbi:MULTISPECIES: universal stress protein [Halococcus]|uniref:UspA domain protein n=1 Tax=Halococcus salifodinae DSM 8989 TaxID=1227456 RepID=M0N3U2_9EURY|nr:MULTISPECIES: universal stress protein [Halococcus]EMA52597.1 uspA domain protein [Halococcus salifodinae DSM 8989]